MTSITLMITVVFVLLFSGCELNSNYEICPKIMLCSCGTINVKPGCNIIVYLLSCSVYSIVDIFEYVCILYQILYIFSLKYNSLRTLLFCLITLRKGYILICLRERNTGILLAVSLVVLNCGYCDAKDAKPILEEFKKDYSSISEACKAVGFVRDACSTQGLSLLLKLFLNAL